MERRSEKLVKREVENRMIDMEGVAHINHEKMKNGHHSPLVPPGCSEKGRRAPISVAETQSRPSTESRKSLVSHTARVL